MGGRWVDLARLYLLPYAVALGVALTLGGNLGNMDADGDRHHGRSRIDRHQPAGAHLKCRARVRSRATLSAPWSSPPG
ncbi:hypothetical protein DSL92_01555 [Billgrantia gudaonensis]|uniref:Uncharacterized protein n=1 Tax=Billgrantia gudaonensis TaxID=376427 RepID=A0A3S0Q1N2_9GAMM|nr:hypothetical protein DSL92_01555 [Halomonas gudaonensis]